MSISLVPYLNFPSGGTRAAFEHYRSIFGGEVNYLTFGDTGVPDMPADGIMHARLVSDSFTLMASDAQPGAEDTWGGTRVYLAFMAEGAADADTVVGWFAALGVDGSIGVALTAQEWGSFYGDVTDRFGVQWMVNLTAPEGWAPSLL